MRKFLESIITFIAATVVCLIASVWYYKTCDIKLLLTAITAGGGAICSLFAIFTKGKREEQGQNTIGNINIKGSGNNIPIIQNNGTINNINLEEVIALHTSEQRKQISLLEELLANTKGQLTFQTLEWDKQKQALEAEVAWKEEQIKQIIKQYENTDTTSSPLYQTAFRLFMDGKLDEALAMLNDAALTEEETKKLEEVVKSRILKAQLLELNYDFEAAEANYLKAVEIFSSFDNNLLLANFYQNLNKFQEAEKFYNQCLAEAKSPDKRATTLNNLGVLQRNKNEQEKTEAAYTEALEIRRQLAKVNPQTYLPDVAMTLNNLGNLQANKNEQEKAEAAYTEALEIRRQLAKVNPQTYLPYVANTLNNLGNLQANKNEQEKAEAAYTEALEIRRQLAKVNPQTYLPYVATTLNNLGILQKNRNEQEKAEAAFTEALEIYRQLAKVNLQTYLPDVAMTLINLSIFYQDNLPNKELSLKYVNEAMECLLPFQKIPYIQQYFKSAYSVVKDWGIDVEEYLKENGFNF